MHGIGCLGGHRAVNGFRVAGLKFPPQQRSGVGGTIWSDMTLLLLDTQVMLWWPVGDSRLTRELLSGKACVVSVASIWEVPSNTGWASCRSIL